MARVYGDRYELRELIATGKGELWRATDKVTHHTVALRISIPVDQRQARLVATVNHPNIERILDFGEDYLVLEDVAGPPFAPIVYSHSLVLRAFAELADGLRAVHEAGGAHGDIEMTDLVSRSDGTVVLTGFGFAAKADDLYRLGSIAAQCLSGTAFARRVASFATFAEFAAAARAEADQTEADFDAATPVRTNASEPPFETDESPFGSPVASAPPGAPPPAPAPVPAAPPPAPPFEKPAPVPPPPMERPVPAGRPPAAPGAPSVAVPVGVSAPPPPAPARQAAPPPAAGGVAAPAQMFPVPQQPWGGEFELVSANFGISVGYPKRVAKGRASAFLVQIHLPKDQTKAAQRLQELLGDNAFSQSGSGSLPLGHEVTIALSSPDIEFSAAKQWRVSSSGIDAAFYGRPAEDAKAGSHVGILTISEGGSELVSIPFTVTIAEFAIGKMSRPTLRGLVTGALVLLSAAVIGYTVVYQVQELIGLVTGTVGAAVSAIVTVRTTALYTRKTTGATKTVPIG